MFINRRLLIASLCLPLIAASPFWQSGESGIVTEIIDGDSFVINSAGEKLVVRMAQIEAPRLRSDDLLSIKARDYLQMLIMGKKVSLKYGVLRRDRMGRALAQVYIDGVWVQGEVLRNGYARIHSYIDNRSHMDDFWFAERDARRNGRGVWTDRKYQARYATPDALEGAEGSFQLVEGKVAMIDTTPTLLKLCFGNDITKDVCALIPQRSQKLFDGNIWEKGKPSAIVGRTIRVRGRINGTQEARTTKKGRAFPAHGPAIWLDHPEQIEFIINPK